MAEFFSGMPADTLMGAFAETSQHPARRSMHQCSPLPAGVDAALEAQTLAECSRPSAY
jgi:hypothetical protein